MPLVGIIAKENDSNFIRNNILKNSLNKKFDIININQKNIENIKNITFESIIINNDIDSILEKSMYLSEIIKKTKYLILNSDNIKNLEFLKSNRLNVITYGLNRKSTVTISSIKDDSVMVCFQRNIENIYRKIIEEQEINIKVKKNNIKKVYNVLAISTIMGIYDQKIENIQKKLTFYVDKTKKMQYNKNYEIKET